MVPDLLEYQTSIVDQARGNPKEELISDLGRKAVLSSVSRRVGLTYPLNALHAGFGTVIRGVLLGCWYMLACLLESLGDEVMEWLMDSADRAREKT